VLGGFLGFTNSLSESLSNLQEFSSNLFLLKGMSISKLLFKSSNLLGEFKCFLKSSSSSWILCFSKLGLEGSDFLSNWFWFGGSGFLLGFL
jgi:hypothetical protein